MQAMYERRKREWLWHSARSVLAFALLLTLGTGLEISGVPLAPAAQAEQAPSNAKPLPIGKTTIIRGRGTRWFIDGPTVIPRRAEISVEQGVTIIGINNATLDVRGGLKVRGTQDTWVTIHKVDFSPTSFPLKKVHLDMVDFRGCKFQHSAEQSIQGGITIENSCFQRDCTFDVRITEGYLKIMTVEFGMPCTVRSIRHKENRKPVEFEVRSSWMKQISFSGPAMANFRHSEIRGGLHCTDVTAVVVDGCDISQTLCFQQGASESFKKLKLTKCNLFNGSTVVCARKPGPRIKKERVSLQRFYFGPKGGGALMKKADIQPLVQDGPDAAQGSIKIGWTKPAKRPHQLVNYDTLRSRAPPLR